MLRLRLLVPRLRGLAARLALTAATVAALNATLSALPAAAAPCDPPVTNPVLCENTKPGNPKSQWDLSGPDQGDTSIQGFATDISYNQGQTVSFKISTPATAYRLDIYRLGYYQGNGARLIASVSPSVSLPQTQPACLSDTTTGLIDCGNWAVSATWAIPSTAVSGVYLAKVTRTDTGGASHIVFIVRDDSANSPIVFQMSDTTWQAYNTYGGNSLYAGSPGTNPGRAYKVSYNRPFATRSSKPESWLFNAEYPMLRWLEANGYNVSYISGIDSDRRGASALETHRVYLSVGHDEYWSAAQRANVEAARDAGINLAFFSGNQTFWKTRYENSIDGTNTAYRTLVSYKETHNDAPIDPADPPTSTGTWRDFRWSPPADGGKPENALAGPLFMVNGTDYRTLQVPFADSRLRFWRNTSVASLTSGQTANITAGCSCVIGYEWDADVDNGARPAGLFDLSSSQYGPPQVLQDYGNVFAQGSQTHSLTLYKAPSGALVFGAGSVSYSWALDATHDLLTSTPDANLQQATVNLLADMGQQPGSLQSGLVAATASTDTSPPTSTITSPAAGTALQVGRSLSISGTASDTGGGQVAGVEVSVDGGTTWHPAHGTTNWSFSWTPGSSAQVTIRSRAVDDSGNLETPTAGVTVGSGTAAACPCSLWSSTTTPGNTNTTDASSLEVGVKFRADQNGFISGIRFYKLNGNTGTHIGNLWTAGGTLLASATFTNESATGWQQVTFGSPVAVTANTVYVASYFTPSGHYADDSGFFNAQGWDNGPLHALSNAAGSGNGLYAYASSSTFPLNTYSGSNYWVDVVFSTSAPATPTPTSTPTTGPSPTPTATPGPANCPCTIWPSTAAPTNQTGNDTNAVEVGLKFTADQSGYVSGVRFYKLSVNTGAHTGHLWTSSGTLLGSVTFSGETASGWQQATFSSPIAITAGTTYVVSYFSPTGHYAVDQNYFATGGVNTPPLHALSNASSGGNGVYVYTSTGGFPNSSFNASNYWVDLVFSTTLPATPTPTSTPTPGPTSTPTVTPTPAACPCTIWPSTAAPNNPNAGDTNAVEVGVKFTSDQSGFISGVRFYKPTAGTGTHTGHLWTSGGTLLGSVTFTGETASGWQQATFSSPIAVTAGTTYVASYFAPAGHYAVDQNTFASAGVDNPPLHALSNGSSGGNGVYVYTSTGGFPTSSFNASNYWVDVVFSSTPPATPTPTNTPTPGPTATPTVTPTPPACPCTIWPSSATPSNQSGGDTHAVETGVKFRSDVSGFITGVRFYKLSGNTGTHVVNLWTSSGGLLATATATSETASGWQQVTFSSPVAISANTTYVASYHMNTGGYADDQNYFAAAVNAPPLHALDNGSSGGNGVYTYNATSAFPNSSFNASNYWVDVVFTTQ